MHQSTRNLYPKDNGNYSIQYQDTDPESTIFQQYILDPNQWQGKGMDIDFLTSQFAYKIEDTTEQDGDTSFIDNIVKHMEYAYIPPTLGPDSFPSDTWIDLTKVSLHEPLLPSFDPYIQIEPQHSHINAWEDPSFQYQYQWVNIASQTSDSDKSESKHKIDSNNSNRTNISTFLACDQCNYSTNRLQNMTRHSATHIQERKKYKIDKIPNP
ncbi:hypothetical protein CLU79DRAFT_774972 [Phycomyces nitens]|nr:hypothetical protein CLU79DRAFT_774972 [Phycomyces nitens]